MSITDKEVLDEMYRIVGYMNELIGLVEERLGNQVQENEICFDGSELSLNVGDFQFFLVETREDRAIVDLDDPNLAALRKLLSGNYKLTGVVCTANGFGVSRLGDVPCLAHNGTPILDLATLLPIPNNAGIKIEYINVCGDMHGFMRMQK